MLTLGAGHVNLNVVISEEKDVKNTAKAFMGAQNSGDSTFLTMGTMPCVRGSVATPHDRTPSKRHGTHGYNLPFVCQFTGIRFFCKCRINPLLCPIVFVHQSMLSQARGLGTTVKGS